MGEVGNDNTHCILNDYLINGVQMLYQKQTKMGKVGLKCTIKIALYEKKPEF